MNSTRARAAKLSANSKKNRRQTAFSQQYARERASPAASLVAADRLMRALPHRICPHVLLRSTRADYPARTFGGNHV
jgi:hypothetical protein